MIENGVRESDDDDDSAPSSGPNSRGELEVSSDRDESSESFADALRKAMGLIDNTEGDDDSEDDDDVEPEPVSKEKSAKKAVNGEAGKKSKAKKVQEEEVVKMSAKRARGADDEKEKKAKKRRLNEKREESSVDLGKRYLEWIVSPSTADQFMNDAWERRPVHVKRGKPDYYRELFSTKELDSILREQHVLFGKNLDVTSYDESEGRQTHNPAGRAHAPVVWDFYNNGCSVRVLNPQTFSESVWKGCATLQEFFGSMVGANVYLTPPGTQGFAPHYDDVEVFMLQLEGRKRWRLYEPRNAQEALPRFSSGNFSQEEIGEPCMDVVLEAGDFIYMPRGTIHQGTCFPDAHSMHITISCHQLNSYGDLLEKMLPAALKTAMEEDIDFRRGLPTDYLSYMGVCHSDEESAKRSAFTKTIGRLVKKLMTYAPVDAAADQMGKKLMHDTLPPYLSASEQSRCVQGDGERWNASKQRVVNRVEIDPGTEIRLVRANALRLVTEGDDVRVYYSVDNTREYHQMEEQFLEVEAEAAPAVEELINRYPEYTRAEELPLEFLDGQMKVVQDLWERRLLVTKQKLESHYDD